MIVFPNCKINLGLSVIGKRDDGYHDLETVFYPIQLTDVLEVITVSDREILTAKLSQVEFSNTGLRVAGNENDNLCIKAYELLRKDFPHMPSVKLHLHKVIPMGAGLGGGSADGAFTLRLLNEKFHLLLTTSQLVEYALQLGSDCPFFILNKPCFASGRGEKMEEIQVDLAAFSFVLVNPGIHIHTGWAFSQLNRNSSRLTPVPSRLTQVIGQPISTWKDLLVNDFEAPVFRKHPEIKVIKDQLYEQGALYASMTGSGSTVYGIFEKSVNPVFNYPPAYTVVKTA